MASLRLFLSAILCLSFIALCAAHGAHDHHQQAPLNTNTDWATRHMAEEHHISHFDAASFFSLHDYDSNGYWDTREIQRTYGLEDESTRDVPLQKRQEVVNDVLALFDLDEDGRIDQQEFTEAWHEGLRLPDFGLGKGIHYSYEVEYELNHFEHFHDENTLEEDLIHPEDIEHFRRHELEDEAEERQARLDSMQIVEENIPQKFRRPVRQG